MCRLFLSYQSPFERLYKGKFLFLQWKNITILHVSHDVKTIGVFQYFNCCYSYFVVQLLFLLCCYSPYIELSKNYLNQIRKGSSSWRISERLLFSTHISQVSFITSFSWMNIGSRFTVSGSKFFMVIAIVFSNFYNLGKIMPNKLCHPNVWKL